MYEYKFNLTWHYLLQSGVIHRTKYEQNYHYDYYYYSNCLKRKPGVSSFLFEDKKKKTIWYAQHTTFQFSFVYHLHRVRVRITHVARVHRSVWLECFFIQLYKFIRQQHGRNESFRFTRIMVSVETKYFWTGQMYEMSLKFDIQLIQLWYLLA